MVEGNYSQKQIPEKMRKIMIDDGSWEWSERFYMNIGTEQNDKTDRILSHAVEYIFLHFKEIQKLIFPETFMDCYFIEKDTVDYETVVNNLKLDTITIDDNNEIITVLCSSEEVMFGHFVEGEFTYQYEFVGSYIC